MPLKKPNKPSNVGLLGLFLRGFFMGSADIIPGVSGGTIAYITGIYPQLIAALTIFKPHWFQLILSLKRQNITQAFKEIPFNFLIPLGFGILSALTVFIWLIPLGKLVKAYPFHFYGLFFGFVLSSALFLLHRYARSYLRGLFFVGIGFIGAYFLVEAVPLEGMKTVSSVFISGALAISAMLLPGVSGALVLVVLGQYSYILEGVRTLDFWIIIPFLAGILSGVLAFSHSLNWCIRHYYKPTMLLMVGLLFGALRALWPFSDEVEFTLQNQGSTFLFFMSVGISITIFFTILERTLKAN